MNNKTNLSQSLKEVLVPFLGIERQETVDVKSLLRTNLREVERQETVGVLQW